MIWRSYPCWNINNFDERTFSDHWHFIKANKEIWIHKYIKYTCLQRLGKHQLKKRKYICLSYKYFLVVIFALRLHHRATLTRFNLGLNNTTPRAHAFPPSSYHGDERGDRSRNDSFSGLLQSALFSAESRGDMEAYNRPLGFEHPHPVSILQDGDQWVTSQSPSKRAMAIYLGISLDTRVGLAYPSERRIERWLSISGDFLAWQAQPALLWLRLLGHLASLEKLVPYGRLRMRPIQFQFRSGWSQTRGQPGSRDPGFHSLVENSFESPQRNPTRIPSDRSLPLHRLKCCGLGCSHGQKDRLRKVVRGHERAAHQCAGTECDLAWSPSLWGYSPGLQYRHYVRQCLCHCLSEKSGGHSVSTDVLYGHWYLRMGRKTVHDTDTQTSPWASQCVSRSSKPQRSVSENRMESESSRSTACIPSLGQSTCGSVCTQVQHQTSNIHVSDSRTGGLESRQSSPIVGRSVRLCIPTNGSDQTDSEQVDLAQSGADPHSPPLSETGMVSGPPTTVNSFPVGTSTNSKVAKAIILPTLPSEASDSNPSRVEVICRSNQARGFSEQVSNRIAVPQRKSTLDLYEQKWNTFREWCELNGINPHTPTVAMIAEFLLHLFRDKQLATITINGYRSALSSLRASRGLDISHDPDLNALIRSFSIERPRTVRETPRWDPVFSWDIPLSRWTSVHLLIWRAKLLFSLRWLQPNVIVRFGLFLLMSYLDTISKAPPWGSFRVS